MPPLKSDQIINPKTNRVIGITSAIAKKLWIEHLKGQIKLDATTIAKLESNPALKTLKLIYKQKKTPVLPEEIVPPKIVVPPKEVKPVKKVVSPTKSYEKPKSQPRIEAIEIKLKVKKASKDDLEKLNKKIQALELKGFSLSSLDTDLKSDAFVQAAVDAHMKALESKVKIYQKLSKQNWGGNEDNKDGPSLSKIIQEILIKLNKEISQRKAQAPKELIQQKRTSLKSILYDPDNGIATIRGKSREGVRVALLKLIYMFFKVPDFFFKGFINYMITGPAGSGKTKVAAVISHVMQNLGILATSNVTMATKQNLVGQYIGQTGIKTRKLLIESLEGVLFIDEAYSLTPCPGQNKDSFSEEAVAELINFMDKFIGCMVVIVAGYKKQMHECFLSFNEGIGRRFPKMIDLDNYNTDDLYNIFENFLSESIDIKTALTHQQQVFIKSIIQQLNNEDVFNNQAGDMLNLSKIIGEDAVLNSGEYSNELILLSFQKFCAMKEYIIDLENTKSR